MSGQFLTLVEWFFLAGAALGSFYLIAATVAVRKFTEDTDTGPLQPFIPAESPPVTVLKPLCGEEPELYDNLRSYCRQDYPALQLVCGVQNPRDPAIDVVSRLIRDFPAVDISLVIRPSWLAGNLKVANLQNMLPTAKHEILIMADADIRVGPDCVAALVAALAQPNVGLVTCLYRARPTAGLWSLLGALHIDHGFLPQAVVGGALGAGSGCFGATLALRKSTLAAIGGFASIAHRLADDHALGEAVRDRGLQVSLSPYLVDTIVAEPSFKAMFKHELRWARTIRTVAPAGFLGSLVTHPVMLALIGNVLTDWTVGGSALLAWTLLCRCAMAREVDRALHLPRSPLWLVPVRDVLSFAVFFASFFIRTVAWRDQRLRIGPGGELIQSRR